MKFNIIYQLRNNYTHNKAAEKVIDAYDEWANTIMYEMNTSSYLDKCKFAVNKNAKPNKHI